MLVHFMQEMCFFFRDELGQFIFQEKVNLLF